MGRGELKHWPDCLNKMSIEDLQGWLNVFKANARIWGPKVAEGALKKAREVEKELARRESESDTGAE